ncbi:MAG TPA: hypothetical protein PLP83_09060 [Candidatus Aminicenantes bacterium]|nr:hypothetical protein [Candidatus Aminicenantes bacterium]
MFGGSILKRIVEKAADRLDVQRSAGFPWPKGYPGRHYNVRAAAFDRFFSGARPDYE